MPNHSPRPCTYPGCTALVYAGSRCPRHAKVAEQRRGNANQRGYGAAWRRIRDAFLWKHPWCIDPFGDHPGEQIKATQVDHRVPRSEGGTDDEMNLEGLCDHCHNKKTAKYDGGFGNPRGGRQESFERSKVNRAPLDCTKYSPIETGN